MVLVLAVTAFLSAAPQPSGTLLDQLKALQKSPRTALSLVRAHEAETLALLNSLLEQFDASIHSARDRPEQRKVEYDAATLSLGTTIARLYADVSKDTRPWRQFKARKLRIEGTEALNARNYRLAIPKLEAAIREADALDDVWLMVITRLNLGYAHIELGHGAIARDLCVRAAKDAERLGPRAKGLAAFDLASALLHLKEYAASIPYGETAVRYSRDVGIKLWEGNALLNLGVAHQELGDYDRAQSSFEQALAVITQTADQLGTGRTLYNLALVSIHQGEYAKAAAYLERALPLIVKVDVRHSHEIELDPKAYYNPVEESALRLLVKTYTTLHDPARAARHQTELDALLRTKPLTVDAHTHADEHR